MAETKRVETWMAPILAYQQRYESELTEVKRRCADIAAQCDGIISDMRMEVRRMLGDTKKATSRKEREA